MGIGGCRGRDGSLFCRSENGARGASAPTVFCTSELPPRFPVLKSQKKGRLMDSKAPSVLLASSDRQLVRQLSGVLVHAGYRVEQASQIQHAEMVLAVDPPELLILDVPAAQPQPLRLLQAATGQEDCQPPFVVLLVAEPTAGSLMRYLEAGANDFVAKPVNYGELLARLRQGIRFRQCERQLLQAVAADATVRLPSRSALADRLQYEFKRGADSPPRAAVAIVELDFFAYLRRQHGEAAGKTMLETVADVLRHAPGESELIGSSGSGCFSVLLPGVSAVEGQAWAESMRKQLGQTHIALDRHALGVTASVGVADCQIDPFDPDAIVQRALEALKQARMSGHDCVVCWDEALEAADQNEASTPVRLLRNATAHDIFSPWPFVLNFDDSLVGAMSLLERTGLPGLPAVDQQGDFLGLLDRDAFDPSGSTEPGAKVGDHLTTDIQTFDEEDNFVTLVEHFADDRESVAVVLRNRRPTGLLTADHLVAPVSEAGSDTFASDNSLGSASNRSVGW